MDHLVIGAGQIGPHVAHQLAEAGENVTLASRSGSGPADLRRRSLDASDFTELRGALEGVDVLHLCLHASAYRASAWKRELPELETTVLAAAAATGTTVVFPESVYAFDTSAPVTGASRFAPRSALGRVRQQLLEQRVASDARTISVIAGDFIGVGVTQSHAGPRMWESTLRGKAVRPIGKCDVVHAWTALPDLAATMIAAPRALEGQSRIVAPAIHATQREVIAAFAHAGGVDAPPIKPIPIGPLRTIAIVDPTVRALASTAYLFTEPLRIHDAGTTASLGVTAMGLDAVAGATIDHHLTPQALSHRET